MLELIYTSHKTVTPQSSYDPLILAYIDIWDAFAFTSRAEFKKIFRDGTAPNIGITQYSSAVLNRCRGRLAWWPYSTKDILAADIITGQPNYSNRLNPADFKPQGLGNGDLVDDEFGVLLYGGYGVITVKSLLNGTTLGTIPVWTATWVDSIVHLTGTRAAVISYGTGKVGIIDYSLRIFLWSSKIAACFLAGYDRAHDLFVSLGTDGQVRIYSTKVVPAVLSPPAFEPAMVQAHILYGRKIRTRLTGDAGEPCPGRVVTWSMPGTPAGSLLKDRSVTDANGYAENYYFGPAIPGQAQDTVRVEVTV